jgi:hypothetical protein
MIAAVSCVDAHGDPCGRMPLAPGYVVGFDNGRATLSVADWTALARWRDDVEAWGACEMAR